jgi:SAM-dependent methyltransferase
MAEAAATASGDRLADQRYWDDYWRRVGLPIEITRSPQTSGSIAAILDVLETYLPRRPGMSALEVGGAPGQYLAWLSKTFGYTCHVLDYSPVGCEKARRNFEALGIPLGLFEGDLFADSTESIGSFDLVYSLGLIEHFDDFGEAIRRHARLASPGGWVVIGCPNLGGINRVLMRALRPNALATHNLDAMDVRRWQRPAEEAGLAGVFTGYVGGFDPRVHAVPERDHWLAFAVAAAMELGHYAMSRLSALRRIDSRLWSGYAIAVYRKR